MARVGVGVGMLEISRVAGALERIPSFGEKVFSAAERAYCDAGVRPSERYAQCLAAHGAVLKSLGMTDAAGVRLGDVAVESGERGQLVARLAGRVAQAAREQGVEEVVISLSRTHEVAVANAVAMTDAARPQPREERDPKREFQASFREAKSIIDELERLQDGIMDTLEGEGQDERPRTDEAPTQGPIGE